MITEIKLELLQEEFIKQIKDSYTLNLSLMLLKEFAKLKQENEELKKQLKERPKEYVFIGNAQNKTRDFINRITKDNKEYENQQQKFIKYLEDRLYNIEPNKKNQKCLMINPYFAMRGKRIYLSTYNEFKLSALRSEVEE